MDVLGCDDREGGPCIEWRNCSRGYGEGRVLGTVSHQGPRVISTSKESRKRDQKEDLMRRGLSEYESTMTDLFGRDDSDNF